MVIITLVRVATLVILHSACHCMFLGGLKKADQSDFHFCCRDWSLEVLVACLRNVFRHLICPLTLLTFSDSTWIIRRFCDDSKVFRRVDQWLLLHCRTLRQTARFTVPPTPWTGRLPFAVANTLQSVSPPSACNCSGFRSNETGLQPHRRRRSESLCQMRQHDQE